MRDQLRIVEKDGRYFIFNGDEEYITLVQSTISSSDKGLVEAILRKMKEGKPNLVKLYLRKFDTLGLRNLIKDLSVNDCYFSNIHFCDLPMECRLFKDVQLRKLIDVYSECGSISFATDIGLNDTLDFDWFCAGMAETSGLGMSPADELVDNVKFCICETYEDNLYSQSISPEEQKNLVDEMDKKLSYSDMVNFVEKYQEFLLPKGPKARSRFFDKLYDC